MKKLLSITVFLAAACLQGADYVKLDQEAVQAVRAKDHALAEMKFGEAMKAARNPAEKCKAVRGKFDAMRKQKKRKEAETFMTEAIADDLKDAGIARSMTDPKHQTGNQDIWKDNCFELFFYAEKSRKLWQVIVNDRNAWSSLTWEKKLPRWEQLKGVKTAVRRTADGWTADITIPFSELQTDRSDLRFNCTRERNLKGKKTEFSTWSPLAMLGNWQGVDNYGTLVFQPENP